MIQVPPGNHTSFFAQSLCNPYSVCKIGTNTTLWITANFSVGALLITDGGSVRWTDASQHPAAPTQYLCAGYIVIENAGSFIVHLQEASHSGVIYIQNNGARHDSVLQTRVLGGLGNATVQILGRPLARTWTLLSESIVGSPKSSATPTTTTLQLMHSPIDMGWRMGDRVAMASMQPLSQGRALAGHIIAMDDTGITVDFGVVETIRVERILTPAGSIALMSPEIVHLSRNIVITGDDFEQIPCDPSLSPNSFTPMGCACQPGIPLATCTLGLHVAMAGAGSTLDIQHTRIEKCGQRGIQGKYCVHFHYMDDCPSCVLRGNALEFGQQRGIVIHETQGVTVESNILYDIRGAGIYLEDGNEMGNQIAFNVIICPYPLGDPVFQGCTVPGTDNAQADTALNQAGIWSLTPTNDVVGNRVANSFNGMFYDGGDRTRGQGAAWGRVNTLFAPLGRLEGNTFHGHGRFGTYLLFQFPKQNCSADIQNHGFLPHGHECTAFTLDSGLSHGLSFAHLAQVDYSNAFVGGYNMVDIQFRRHVSIGNLNNVYWKETAAFVDTRTAHISGGYYRDGNLALPDGAAFVIENTVFEGASSLETNHHCNVGITGILCMPTYILCNVTWRSTASEWVQWHAEANRYGGIVVLCPWAERDGGEAAFFPPGFVSLVSSTWTYLLDIPLAGCLSTWDPRIMAAMGDESWKGITGLFGGGILCRQHLRSLKIYSRSQTMAQHMDLHVVVTDAATGAWVTEFTVIYHQIGDDGSHTRKQGYAFPVVTGTQYVWTITTPIPASWIVDFSEAVFGTRWEPDLLLLTVAGTTGCQRKRISSRHDRSWIWADSGDYLWDQAWGGGACGNRSAPAVVPALCRHGPSPAVGADSGHCPGVHWRAISGSGRCICAAGFYGAECQLNTCDGITCVHGRCVGEYLGGELVPSRGACVCDAGWSGPTCESQPCRGVDCSGRGVCQATDELGWKCECRPNYAGKNCEYTCMGFGCASDSFPFGCAVPRGQQAVCLKGGGCYYTNTWIDAWGAGTNICCYSNCDKCDLVECRGPQNDCWVGETCVRGECRNATMRVNGAMCNDRVNGICLNGTCLSVDYDSASWLVLS